jgi:hypothetical protein
MYAQLLKKAKTELGDEYPLIGFSKKGKKSISLTAKKSNIN